MQFGLSENTINQIVKIFSSYPQIDEAIVFGSRAKGNFKPGSDVDITIKGNKLTIKELNQISLALDDLPLPYIFDLSIYHQINNPELIEHIERVGKVIYTRTSI